MGNREIGHFPGAAGDKALNKVNGNQLKKHSMIENELTVRDLRQAMPGQRNYATARRKSRDVIIRRHERVTMTGGTVSLSDAEHYIHLEVRRFAGCPNGQRGVRFRRKGDRLCHR
jgi:hypothetical protein